MLPEAGPLPNVPPGSADWAVLRAQDALAGGHFALAIPWLQRAARLVRDDAIIQLMLASAKVHDSPDEAVTILEALAARYPHDRDAALALAMTLLRAGHAGLAAARLSDLLGRATPPDTVPFQTAAAAICSALGAPGWVWLDGAGTCHLHLTDTTPTSTIVVEMDGIQAGVVRVRRGRTGAQPLPDSWRRARHLVAAVNGTALIGSGLRPCRFAEVSGFAAEAPGGAVQGWATVTADPAAKPCVFVREPDGTMRPVTVDSNPDPADPSAGRPAVRWRFSLAAGQLAGLSQAAIVDPDGRNLWGSPILLGVEQASARHAAQALASRVGSRPDMPALWDDPFRPLPAALLPVAARRGAAPGRRPPCDVVVPVYGGAAELELCLRSLAATMPKTSRLVLIDDGSPDPEIAARLMAAAGPRVTVLQHATPQGFPAAVNAGLRHLWPSANRDVVILNADTVVSGQWLARLSAVAHSDPAIGSVTPLTNDGTIVCYPAPGPPAPMPGAEELDALNRLCWEANGVTAVTIPTGVGFCMLMKGACLAEAGLFRDDVFAQGYGEENDWCLRAAHLGWRHVAAPGVFVAHSGGRSFGAAKSLLLERNAAVLERLHPGYAAYVHAAMAPEPLLPARRRIDRLRLLNAPGRSSVVLVTHDAGGGVARLVASRGAEIAASGRRPIVLVPDEDRPGLCLVSLGAGKHALPLPNLHFDLPSELDALVALLRDAQVEAVEIHHLLHHQSSISRLPSLLGVPHEVYVHDYGYWCPRISLIGRGNRYCGEPLSAAECEECVADLGSRYEDGLTVHALRQRSATLLGGARRVVVSCEDVVARTRRQFPSSAPVVQAWETPVTPLLAARTTARPVHAVLVGAIGIEKGYEVLLGCARDAARRSLDLRFTVVGYTIDDHRLMATGRVFVTGMFDDVEGLGLVREQGGTVGFVPSVCPETWCFALSLLWQAGLPVLGFALGAQGARISRSGAGWVIPPGLPAAKINDTLVKTVFETVQPSPASSSRQGT